MISTITAGIETEYGMMLDSNQAPDKFQAALQLLQIARKANWVAWDNSGEFPMNDARNPQSLSERQADDKTILDSSNTAGFLLPNGARFYVDHGHPEYATAETDNLLMLLANDKAGERILNHHRDLLEHELGFPIRLFKNNHDEYGHSYGCHENYALSSDLYDSLFQGKKAELHTALIPFLLSRQIIAGSGKVGSHNNRRAVNYQISQRADFFEQVLGVHTMQQRSIINTRDEAHAQRQKISRLHIILGDANMSELSTYLKIGTTRLLLAMLEADFALPRLEIKNPLEALIRISHDLSCQHNLELMDGQQMRALDLQWRFAEAAAAFVDATGEFKAVFTKWIEVLEQLEVDVMGLSTRLDWVIKLRHLEEQIAQNDYQWNSPEIKTLDYRYHDINPKESIFYILQEARQVETLLQTQAIEFAMHNPPEGSRAHARAEYIQAQQDKVIAANWRTVTVRLSTDKLHRQEFWSPSISEDT